MGLGSSSSSSKAAEIGLTRDGIEELIPRSAITSEHNARIDHTVRSRSYHAVCDIVEYVVMHGEATVPQLMDDWFPQAALQKPKEGMYGQGQGRDWYRDVAAPILRPLDCLEADGETWRWVGVDRDDHDPDHVRPIDELRSDPYHSARQLLDGLIPRRTETRELAYELYGKLRREGRITEDQVAGIRAPDADNQAAASAIEELPGVDRETVHPPKPEDIQVETYADVLDAEKRVNQSSTTALVYTSRQ